MIDQTNNDLLFRIETSIRDLFKVDTSGHDINHLKRTMNLARHIQTIEGGDELVIAAAALLHDVHRLEQLKTGQFCSPEASLSQIEAILNKTGFPADRIDKVLHCVKYHEEYSFSVNGRTVDDLETLILQDADNLDAMGAIGIGRTFLFGGAHGVPMWVPEIPLPDRDTYDEETSMQDPSVLHHFHAKLLKLKNTMNTETAKRMAEARHQVMERFVVEFIAEWYGEK